MGTLEYYIFSHDCGGEKCLEESHEKIRIVPSQLWSSLQVTTANICSRYPIQNDNLHIYTLYTYKEVQDTGLQ